MDGTDGRSHSAVTTDVLLVASSIFFFFNDTATTEIYTLSLHDALPICWRWPWLSPATARGAQSARPRLASRRSEEHTSELQSQSNLVCRLLLEKKKTTKHESSGKLQQITFSVPQEAGIKGKSSDLDDGH